jgi:acyl carrier protein
MAKTARQFRKVKTMSSTLDTIKGIMARIVHRSKAEINPETMLKDLKADSLHWVQIIVATESAFDIEIDIDKIKEMATVNDFVSYAESCRKK